MKRIVTVQDISCIGKCSLTVALPIISAMGTETAVIPTAVLSAHTAFDGFVFTDLTDRIEPIADHWQKENIAFDAVYTGYLGSYEQINIVESLVKRFRADGTKVIVDPVMGDNGRLYSGFDRRFAARMAQLCAEADIILPNYTEACLILIEPYDGATCSEQKAREMLPRLTETGTGTAVITGVTGDDGGYGAVGYSGASGEYFSAFCERIGTSYHGTGDIFASAFVGALMRDKSMQSSLEIAVGYTAECIKATVSDPNARWYGVNFEAALPWLINKIM